MNDADHRVEMLQTPELYRKSKEEAMSGEAFQTPMTADMATAPDGKGMRVGRAGAEQPRAFAQDGSRNSGGWVTAYLYAEPALRVCAETVRTQVMTGLTGDHPDERKLIAALLHASADLVRELSRDDACDGSFDESAWQDRLATIAAIATGVAGSDDADDTSEVGSRRRWGSVHLIAEHDAPGSRC